MTGPEMRGESRRHAARSSALGKLRKHIVEGTLGARIHAEIGRWSAPRAALAARARARLRTAWEQVEGGPGWVEVRVPGGAVVRLPGSSVLGSYICRNEFEAAELLFLERFLRSGDVFVDVGANIGLFTVAAGRRVGARGRVIAFEPGSAARQQLLANVRRNGLRTVTVSEWALSSGEGTLQLAVPDSGLEAFGSLAQPIAGESFSLEAVQVRGWDAIGQSLLPNHRVTMMKIDVEGWELRVLEGARKFLEGNDAPLLQVEFTESAARSAGSDCATLYRALRGLGFEICRFDPLRNELVPEAPRTEYPYVNLYATKALASVRARLARAKPWRFMAGGGLPVVYRLSRVNTSCFEAAH